MSRIDTAVDTLVAEYKTITVANGYRNNVGDNVTRKITGLDKAINLPVVVVIASEGELIAIDEARTVFNEKVRIDTYGCVEGSLDTTFGDDKLFTAMESLLTDMKSVTAKIMAKYVIPTGNQFVIMKDNVKTFRSPDDWGKIKGVVGVSFTILIRNEDNTFSA